MRILAQHPAHGAACPPCSLDLEPVLPCHSSCISPCTRFGNNQRIWNNNSQRLCTPLPPEPAQQTAQLPRTAAAHSRRRRHRQPRASDAHPCTALCARRRGVAYRLNLEQVSLCHSSCTTPMHTVRQQPARLITSHCQQMCAPLLPSRCTGMRRQDNSPSPLCRLDARYSD